MSVFWKGGCAVEKTSVWHYRVEFVLHTCLPLIARASHGLSANKDEHVRRRLGDAEQAVKSVDSKKRETVGESLD